MHAVTCLLASLLCAILVQTSPVTDPVPSVLALSSNETVDLAQRQIFRSCGTMEVRDHHNKDQKVANWNGGLYQAGVCDTIGQYGDTCYKAASYVMPPPKEGERGCWCMWYMTRADCEDPNVPAMQYAKSSKKSHGPLKPYWPYYYMCDDHKTNKPRSIIGYRESRVCKGEDGGW